MKFRRAGRVLAIIDDSCSYDGSDFSIRKNEYAFFILVFFRNRLSFLPFLF